MITKASEATPWSDEVLEDYCKRYLQAVGARLLPSARGTLCTALPRDVDKELTDRPFYWMWVETMHETPPETVLFLTFRDDVEASAIPEACKIERIHAGSYRMQRIVASARQRGAFAVAYQRAPIVSPFVLMNVKVSYLSDRRLDRLESYLVDLRDYRIYHEAMSVLTETNLSDERPLETQILAVPMDFDQIFSLVKKTVQRTVALDDHTWSRDASQRLNRELRTLDDYYASLENTTRNPHSSETPETPEDIDPVPETLVTSFSRAAERELRRAELVWRGEPRVEVRPLQVGLLYLADVPEMIPEVNLD